MKRKREWNGKGGGVVQEQGKRELRSRRQTAVFDSGLRQQRQNIRSRAVRQGRIITHTLHKQIRHADHQNFVTPNPKKKKKYCTKIIKWADADTLTCTYPSLSLSLTYFLSVSHHDPVILRPLPSERRRSCHGDVLPLSCKLTSYDCVISPHIHVFSPSSTVCQSE